MARRRLLHKIGLVFAVSIVFAFGCVVEPSRAPVPHGAKNRGTRTHKRFLAVSEILAHFEVDAYELTKPQSAE